MNIGLFDRIGLGISVAMGIFAVPFCTSLATNFFTQPIRYNNVPFPVTNHAIAGESMTFSIDYCLKRDIIYAVKHELVEIYTGKEYVIDGLYMPLLADEMLTSEGSYRDGVWKCRVISAAEKKIPTYVPTGTYEMRFTGKPEDFFRSIKYKTAPFNITNDSIQ